jgi:hypothetical protein
MTVATVDNWLRPSEAARALDCSPSWIIRLADSGRLLSQRTRFGRLIDPRSIEAFRRQRDAAETR